MKKLNVKIDTYLKLLPDLSDEQLGKEIKAITDNWSIYEANEFVDPFDSVDEWAEWYNACEEELIKREAELDSTIPAVL